MDMEYTVFTMFTSIIKNYLCVYGNLNIGQVLHTTQLQITFMLLYDSRLGGMYAI